MQTTKLLDFFTFMHRSIAWTLLGRMSSKRLTLFAPKPPPPAISWLALSQMGKHGGFYSNLVMNIS